MTLGILVRGEGTLPAMALCDGASMMTRKANAKSALRPNPESSEGEEITIDGSGSIIKLSGFEKRAHCMQNTKI